MDQEINYKKRVSVIFSNSTTVAFAYLKLVVAIATIIFYGAMTMRFDRKDKNYIMILMFTIVLECVAAVVFVTGYKGKKLIYLSWYNFTSYLFIAMKLSIGFIFVYFSRPLLVCPYVPLIFVDLILLFAMRKELKEHDKKTEVQFEFVNKLADHENTINIMVPYKMDEKVVNEMKDKEIKQEKKDSVPSIETGTIARESLGTDKAISLKTYVF